MNNQVKKFLRTYNNNKNFKRYQNKLMPKSMLLCCVFNYTCADFMGLYGHYEITFRFDTEKCINYVGDFDLEPEHKKLKLRKQWQNFKERLIENYTNHIKEYIEDNELPFSFTIETNHIVDDIFDLTIKFNEKDFDTQYIVDSSKD